MVDRPAQSKLSAGLPRRRVAPVETNDYLRADGGIPTAEERQARKERVETLRAKLADRHDFEADADAACEVCGTSDDVGIDPGRDFDDLQHRCEEHTRLRIKFWLFPGNHPSMPAEDNLFECDECGDEFVFPYGVYGMQGARYRSRFDEFGYRCLDCVDLGWIRQFCESQNRMSGFEAMYETAGTGESDTEER